MFNYHTHTVLCGHAQNTVEEMVLSAIDRGFSEIGISEHFGSCWFTHTIRPENADFYFAECRRVKEKYKDKIKVRIGVELEWEEYNHNIRFNDLKKYDPDYIIGSVHILKGFNFTGDQQGYDCLPFCELDSIIIDYFSVAADMIRSGQITCLGHFDHYKKRYVLENEEKYYPYYDEIAKALRDCNVAMELNTTCMNGVGKYINDPNYYMLDRCREYNVPVVVTGDSHRAEDIDLNIQNGINLLKSVGIKETCRFDRMNIIREPIV